jgi:putative AlgH/UPF0301 family transcriptional regulator
VRRGLYTGGGLAVAAHVRAGDAPPGSVKWYYKYAGWGEGQLESEVKRHVWYPVSCSTELLTVDVEPDAPDEMWHSVMELIDDDFRRVSRQVRAEAKRL